MGPLILTIYIGGAVFLSSLFIIKGFRKEKR